MRQVKLIPKPESHLKRDPWLDKVLNGKRWHLRADEWGTRYKNIKSAAAAIKQAADKRGVNVVVAIRGTDLYVDASGGNGKR